MQVVPEGIESVNGSSETMGCTSPLEDSGGVTVCRSQSYLVDGCSPDIDTSTSDWASHLVTVRRNEGNPDFDHAHVLLTFGFETAVSPTEIEIDLFHCPDWDIGAPRITVYVNEEYNLAFPTQDEDILFLPHKESSQSSCDSLLTVSITGDLFDVKLSFRTFHILVDLSHDPSIQWVYIGDVRINSSLPSNLCFPMSSSVISATSHICVDSTESCISNPSSTMPVSLLPTSDFFPPNISSPGPPLSGNQTGLIVGVSVAIGAIILCLFVALLVGIRAKFAFKSRQKHGDFSELDIRWHKVAAIDDQDGTNNIGHDFSNENHGNHFNLGNHELNHADTMYPQSELPNYDDLNNNPSMCNPSLINHVEGFSDGVYDEVPKEDLGVLEDGTEYDDVEPPTFGASLTVQQSGAPQQNSMQSATHVYSHVKKSLPAVPQKSNDLIKYLSVDEAKHQALNSATDPEGRSTTRHESFSSRLAYNPVYEGSAEAMSLETHRFLESATGEGLYDRPGIHRAAPLANVHEGFEVEGATPQPSAPIINEPIQPSDFTNGYEGDDGGDPHIYAPVYAVPTLPSEASCQPFVITNKNIIEKKELGMGQFGKVVLAATNGLSLKEMQMSDTDDNKNVSILVAVKRLAAKPSMEDRQGFEKEIKLMSCLKHKNVVSLIGVCYQDPAFIMMEYMEEGDLNRFLKRYSEIVPIITTSTKTQITTSTLVYMASQIASAMQYLASQNYIHRDLASRNCLVGTDFIVKLADFGMSRSLYQSHYYRIQGNAILPIRWMATESFFGIFSEKTDVWAFGVTMWELFTLGKIDPYSNFTDTELVADAIKGVNRQLLQRPPACPKSLYKIMQQCWIIEPQGRATFRAVEEMLQKYWYTPDTTL